MIYKIDYYVEHGYGVEQLDDVECSNIDEVELYAISRLSELSKDVHIEVVISRDDDCILPRRITLHNGRIV